MSDHTSAGLSYPPKIECPTPKPIRMICHCDICESFRTNPQKAMAAMLNQLYELDNLLMDT